MKHEITAEEVKFAINAKELNRILPRPSVKGPCPATCW